MPYHDKAEFYGSFVEFTHYEKAVVTENVQKLRTQRRSFAPFQKRRLDNVLRAKRLFVRRVQSALAKHGAPLFITLTFSSPEFSFGVGVAHIQNFFRKLQKLHNGSCYVYVPEYHASGAIHYHVLLWGVPLEYGDIRVGRRTISIGEERKTRVLANLWGQGFLDCKRTDGSDRLAEYLAKYMIKASLDLPSSMRSYAFSKGFPRPVVIKGTGDYLPSLFRGRPVKFSSSYRSVWLGNVSRIVYDVRDFDSSIANIPPD